MSKALIPILPKADLLLLFSDTSPTASSSGDRAASAIPKFALATSTLASAIFASKLSTAALLN